MIAANVLMTINNIGSIKTKPNSNMVTKTALISTHIIKNPSHK